MSPDTTPAANQSGYVDWGSFFAGAVVAAGASLVLTTFAGALGLSSVSISKDGGLSTLGLIITGLFTAISVVAVYMLGGYVAGRMRRGVLPPGGSSDPQDSRQEPSAIGRGPAGRRALFREAVFAFQDYRCDPERTHRQD